MGKRPSKGVVSDDPNIERRIWEAIEETFRAHERHLYTDPSVPFPQEISLFVADAISEMLAGGEPESWRVFRHQGMKSGAPRAAAQETGNILVAVAYIKACRIGLISDRSPNKTVSKAYGAAPSTIRDWCRNDKYKDVSPSLEGMNGIKGDPTEFLKTLLQSSGHNYKASKRTHTHQAIRARSKRNSAKGAE